MTQIEIIVDDCRRALKRLPDASVQLCLTSPPYLGLRDYQTGRWSGGDKACDHAPRRGLQGADGDRANRGHTEGMPMRNSCTRCGARREDSQIGLEPTPAEFVAALVEVFQEVWRVLRPDGLLVVNLGDSYAGSWGAQGNSSDNPIGGNQVKASRKVASGAGKIPSGSGLKPKDLIGVPWAVAKALQAPRYTGQIKELSDRVWLAAMLDGEGCMFIQRRKAGTSTNTSFVKKNGERSEYLRTQDSFGPGIEITNTHEAIIRRCVEIAGVGSVCRQDNGRRLPLFRWNVRGNEARQLVKELYPHLVGKQHEARILCGSPSSGPLAASAHSALIDLHNGRKTEIDFEPPDSCFEPGWYLRQEIIWSKTNPTPESVLDRCTKAHESVFLLSKSGRPTIWKARDTGEWSHAPDHKQRLFAPTKKRPQRWAPRWIGLDYFFDVDAIAEEAIWQPGGSHDEVEQGGFNDKGVPPGPGQNQRAFRAIRETRRKRSVWSIATEPFSGPHFATMPTELARVVLTAASRPGDLVLDPFGGVGTTALVAQQMQRRCTMIELNPSFAAMAEDRLRRDAGLLADVRVA